MNEFNEYVRECFSEAGEIVIKSMMGGYLVYFKGKLIGDICGDELFLKRTPTSDRLLADSELRYPYEGSKRLMHVLDNIIAMIMTFGRRLDLLCLIMNLLRIGC